MSNNMLYRLMSLEIKLQGSLYDEINQIEEDTNHHARVLLIDKYCRHILLNFLEPFHILDYNCYSSQTCGDFVLKASINMECVTRDRRYRYPRDIVNEARSYVVFPQFSVLPIYRYLAQRLEASMF